MEEENEASSKNIVEEYVNQVLQYPMDEDELATVDKNIRKEIFEHYDYESIEKELQEAKNKRREHWQDNFQGLFKRNFIDTAKTLVNDIASDVKNVQESKVKKNEKEKSLDHMASNETIKYVIDFYQDNIDDAQKKLSTFLDEYWREKEIFRISHDILAIKDYKMKKDEKYTNKLHPKYKTMILITLKNKLIQCLSERDS